MFPAAGGQYVYLREAFGRLPAFLFGWTQLTVIQTGTIAAVAVAFARFLGALWPAVGEQALWGLPAGAFAPTPQRLVAIGLVLGPVPAPSTRADCVMGDGSRTGSPRPKCWCCC